MHTVDLYRKVRLACRDGMSERAAAPPVPSCRDRALDAVVIAAAGKDFNDDLLAVIIRRVPRVKRPIPQVRRG